MFSGSSQWKNFTEEEHRYNVRAFETYKSLDRAVIESSSCYHNLPTDATARTGRSRKARTTFTTTSGSDVAPKRKRRFVIRSSSSSDESDDDGHGSGSHCTEATEDTDDDDK